MFFIINENVSSEAKSWSSSLQDIFSSDIINGLKSLTGLETLMRVHTKLENNEAHFPQAYCGMKINNSSLCYRQSFSVIEQKYRLNQE